VSMWNDEILCSRGVAICDVVGEWLLVVGER
jgi:hypothetical protein